MELKDLRKKVADLSRDKVQAERNLKTARISHTKASRELSATDEARALVQLVAKQTQDHVKYHITELGTTALEAVFGGDIRLDLQFRTDKGKTVADLLFLRGED